MDVGVVRSGGAEVSMVVDVGLMLRSFGTLDSAGR